MAGCRSATDAALFGSSTKTFGAQQMARFSGVIALSASRIDTACSRLSKSRTTGTPSSSSRACPANCSSSAHASAAARNASFTDLGRRPGRSRNQPFARVAASSTSREPATSSPAARRSLAAAQFVASPGIRKRPFLDKASSPLRRRRSARSVRASSSETSGTTSGAVVGVAASGTSACCDATSMSRWRSGEAGAACLTTDPSRRAAATSLNKSRAALSLSPEIVDAAQGRNRDAASSS
mmetsp:Transcript_14627/g.38698  ORF Transcript_14627/g.38698 Transcript_14627/m.38698 type:complete len:239 (-) Transcript_14627:875-1591(-)